MKNNKKRRKMKKLIRLAILILIILVAFIACIKIKDNIEGNKGNNIDNNADDIGKIDNNTDSNQNSNNNNNQSDSNNTDSNEPVDNTDNNPDSAGEDRDNETIETFLDENNMVTNSDSIEVVVNKERNLSEDYVPSDLVKITDVPTLLASPEVNQLRKPAAEALTKLVEAAKEEINIQLYARSGYRSYRTQESTYNGYVKNHGQAEADKFSAKAGQSEHQTGLAIDISSESVNFLLEEEFGDTVEGKWVAENAHRFGFIVRYPKGKEDVTGYMYEPWHLRYLGVDLATKVYESGLTLEQYFFDNAKEQ